MIDSKNRTFLKACSWRLLAIFLLGVITYLLTGSLKTVTLVTLFYHSVQILMFFLHERVWNYIKWGKTRGIFIQMCGMSGAGKTTISSLVARKLRSQGYKVELIDGDEYRQGISRDLSFSKRDRIENIYRLGFIGQILARNNVIAIMAAINPYQEPRKYLEENGALTVYVKCNVSVLRERDTKGLYEKALLEDGHPEKVYNFTGISDPFEEPPFPDLYIDTETESINQSVDKLYRFILEKSN